MHIKCLVIDHTDHLKYHRAEQAPKKTFSFEAIGMYSACW